MKALEAKVAKALETDNSIVASAAEALRSNGFTEEYFARLGLERRDLKKLEVMGLAVRGYTKNIWLPGEKLPNGKVAKGEMVELPYVEEIPYVDARGYDRVRKVPCVKAQPTLTYRGRGHRVRWILIAKDGAHV